ncbi:hypothetical protein LCGC14_0768260 [marine sediment metagenome]|uniref:DUF2383 domain-containing protein n=1 Tax=marine sediment metagenome TaxID=412755 RepID=A0A0F9T5Z7_9ZZZZ|nr:hypothetical protein [Methylophaga sp.]
MLNASEQSVIHELKTICADGHRFYDMTARIVVSSEIRLLFHEMAHVRADIVNDINERFPKLEDTMPCSTSLALSMRSNYKLTHGMCDETIDKDCLADLEAMETWSLAILKVNVRNIRDRRMSSYLAGHLANIQLSQDRFSRFTTDDRRHRRSG